MKRKILCVLLCVLAGIFLEAGISFADEPIRIGVMKFQARSEGVSQDQAAAAGDIFARTLAKSKTVRVIEREQLDMIAAEHRLAMTGRVSDQSAAQLGKLAGCQYILIGSVTNLEQTGSSVKFWVFGMNKHHAEATLDVRVVNVETSEVVMSFSETGISELEGSSIQFYGTGKDKVQLSGMLSGAIADAAERLSYKVREAMTGEYAQVIEPGTKEVMINIGDSGGARHGRLYRVYVDGEEIKDADGTSLGRKMNDIAVVKIIDVQKDFSIAESAGSGAGKISLIRKGDKVKPITENELKALVKRKVFPQSRVDTDNAKYENLLSTMNNNTPKRPETKPKVKQGVIPEVKKETNTEAPAVKKSSEKKNSVKKSSSENKSSTKKTKKKKTNTDFTKSSTNPQEIVPTYQLSVEQKKKVLLAHIDADNLGYKSWFAYAKFTELAESYSGDYLAAYKAGVVAHNIGKDSFAEEWFAKALQINPDYEPAKTAQANLKK